MAMTPRKRAQVTRGIQYAVLVVAVLAVAIFADWGQLRAQFVNSDIAPELFPTIITTALKNTVVYTTGAFVFGLAPAVRDGRLQLHGVDLKGGMEILMGEDLFTTVSTTPAEAVQVLEQLVEWMRQRTKAYAGRVRSHAVSVEEPLHVVMIDELAALTAYCSNRDLQRRAENAINLLCSQGRAPGFMVFACLQDPRKEVIPSRGLFTQMIGLRLKEASETAMVLGELAVASGAHCHRITRDMPGTGYVIPEGGGHPVRVRAGYADDDSIRRVAAEFASPTHMPVMVTEPGPDSSRRRPGGEAA